MQPKAMVVEHGGVSPVLVDKEIPSLHVRVNRHQTGLASQSIPPASYYRYDKTEFSVWISSPESPK